MFSVLVPLLLSGLFVVQALERKEENGRHELLTKAQGRIEEKDASMNELRLTQQEAKINTLISAIDDMKRFQNQKDEIIHKIQLDLDNLRFENSQLKQSFSKCEGQIQSMLVAFNNLEKTNMNYVPRLNKMKTKTIKDSQKAEAASNVTRSLSKYIGKKNMMISSNESKRGGITQNNEGEDVVKRTVSGRHVGTDLVAFFATLSQTVEHLGAHQNVLFNNIITNVGAGYNQHLGGFTAPVSGMYVFMTTLLSQLGHNAHFQLVRNGYVVCNMVVYGRSGAASHETSAGSFVLQLNKGDVVAIQNLDSGEILYGYNYSYFSGFLLKEMDEDHSIVG